MQVRLTRRAERDLDRVERYTVERFGVGQWMTYSVALEEGLATLARFPEIGIDSPILPRVVRAYRCDQHWLCYRVEADVIRVTAIIRSLADYRRR